jgi:hypothetical protein
MSRKEPKTSPAPAMVPVQQGGLPSSRAELRLRLQTVRNMMVGQYSVAVIVQYCRNTWGVKTSTAKTYVRRVHQRLAREGDLEQPFHKQKIILTTQRQLQTLLSANDRMLTEVADKKTSAAQRKWNQIIVSRNNQAIVRTLVTLADLTGAREPLKVEVGFAQARALDGVLQELSPEKLERLRANYAQDRELAQKARAQEARVLLRLDDGTEVQDVASVRSTR